MGRAVATTVAQEVEADITAGQHPAPPQVEAKIVGHIRILGRRMASSPGMLALLLTSPPEPRTWGRVSTLRQQVGCARNRVVALQQPLRNPPLSVMMSTQSEGTTTTLRKDAGGAAQIRLNDFRTPRPPPMEEDYRSATTQALARALGTNGETKRRSRSISLGQRRTLLLRRYTSRGSLPMRP